LQLAREQKPDLIFLDMRMPVLDGEKTVDIIRSDENLEGIIVIAISASVEPKKIQKLLENGCDGFLPKPFKKEALYNIIGSQFELQWQYEEKNEQPVKPRSKTIDTHLPQIAIPTGTVKLIREFAVRGSAKKITKTLEDLVATDAQFSVWQNQLIPLVERYRFEQIIKILDEV
jgi:CheY-like chemotaxis protein